MATVQVSSFHKKLDKYLDSQKGKKKIKKEVDKIMLSRIAFETDDIHSAEEAAVVFVKQLRTHILESIGHDFSSGQIGVGAAAELLDIGHSKPKYVAKLGTGKRAVYMYTVDIFFKNDLSRQSLMPSVFPEGISNIAALLNRGYKNAGSVPTAHQVTGKWHGKTTKSLQQRSGAEFIDDTIRDFMDNSEYKQKYNIHRIRVKDIYGIRT